MARTDTLPHFLTDVADAIREKKGSSDTIQASDFDTEIANLPSGGGKYAPSWVKFRNYGRADLSYETTNIDTSNIVSMDYMFYNCNALLELDLSGWEIKEGVNFAYMFSGCTRLRKIDMRNIDTSHIGDKTNMLSNVPTTCLIIVGTDTDKTWFATNFPTYTNVKTVAEYEAE